MELKPCRKDCKTTRIERKIGELPTEKLLDILRVIYPEEVALDLYGKLTGRVGEGEKT